MNAALRIFLAFAPLFAASAQAQHFGPPPHQGGQGGHVMSPPSPIGPGAGGPPPQAYPPGGHLGHGAFLRPPGSGYAGYGGYGGYGRYGGYGGYGRFGRPGAGYGGPAGPYGGGYNYGGGAGGGYGGGAGGGDQGYGGCMGCSYIGDYNSNNGAPSKPAMAPAKRIQGQWRNGLWYY